MDGPEAATGGTACAWDAGNCEGTPYCPPRCPRFVDDEGVPHLVEPLDLPTHRSSLVSMYEDVDAYNRTLGLPPVSRGDIVTWVEYLADEGRNLVAVRDDGTVVGHVAAIEEAGADPEFVIFVDGDSQGRGIGTELLKHLLAHAAAAGESALRLVVERGNEAAVAVFRSLGFEVTERYDWDEEMRLPLDDPIAVEVQRPPAKRDV